jgi:hypothetical protein
LSRESRRRLNAPWLVPAALGLAVLATLIAVVVVSQRVGGEDLRPPAPPFAYTGERPATVRLNVKQAGGGKITLVEDAAKGAPAPASREFAPGTETVIEVLAPVESITQVTAGDWVSVIGIPNEVRNFTIHAVVVLRTAGQPDAEHVKHSPAGFAGYEAAPDANDRVLVGGPVERVDGSVLTLSGPAGSITVQITSGAPLYLLVAGTVAGIHEGDRVAVQGMTATSPPSAILVQPARSR